jgi:GT2 family glycosyltransferase
MPGPSSRPPAVSIVVANWNGAEWIARCLSSLLVSARAARLDFELIVADDASADGSPALVAARFPRVRLLRNPRNLGFRRTINRGARAARGRVLVLCNNDLVAQEGFVGSLVRWFGEPAAGLPLFAVSARTIGWWDGRPNQLCMGAVWRGGRITPAWSDPAKASPCLFAQAGAAAYDRALFLRLGGLAPLYEPGYWEDYDLSWSAARRGWRQLYDPEAVALHVGGGSMTRRFGADAVAMMKARNHLLFEWRHLRDAALVAEHAARLPLAAARGDRHFGRAFRGALARLPLALRLRLGDPRGPVPDAQILEPWRDFQPSF